MKYTHKEDFPIFKNNPGLIYLDSGATAQKPQKVIDDIKYFCEHSYANIHRGKYDLSLFSTQMIENARSKIAYFLGTSADNLSFTKNATEGSNLIANGLFEYLLNKKEEFEIVCCIADHHANFLPWLARCKKNNINIQFVYPDKNGIFEEKSFLNSINKKTKVMILPHVSNVTGQIFPINSIKKQLPDDVFVIADLSQSVPHIPVNFDKMNIDGGFFTGHKLGAGGVGGLLLSSKLSALLSPLLLGGDIIKNVSTTEYSLINAPEVFESGTPPIENILGLQSAVEYIDSVGGIQSIRNHEKELIAYGISLLEKNLPEWGIIGPKNENERSGNITIQHQKIHHEDIGIFLAEKNICVRTGFHCANPFHEAINSKGTIRMSFWIYNTKEDIEKCIKAIEKAQKILL